MNRPDEPSPGKEAQSPSLRARRRVDASSRNMRTACARSSGSSVGASMEGLPAEKVTTKVRGFGFYQAVPIYMMPRGLGQPSKSLPQGT